MQWWQLLEVGLASLVVAVVVVATQRWHERWTGDFQDGGVQKHHSGSPPRVGGLALLAGLLVALIAIDRTAPLGRDTARFLFLLCAASVPVVALGLAEDLTKKVRPRLRLLGAIVSAVLGMLLFDNMVPRVNIPGLDAVVSLAPIAVVLTALMVSGFANAMNIIDGLNGLSSGLAVLMLAATGVAAMWTNDQVVFTLCMVLAAAIAGFVVINFPRGLMFLGDGGAYFIGFALAELWILMLIRNADVSTWFVVAIAAHPTMETVFSMYRRRLRIRHGRGGAFSVADCLHLHTLVYRRRTRVLGQRMPWVRGWVPNAMASVWVLAMASLPMMAACLAPASSFWCATVLGVYVFAYVLWFRRLVWFGRMVRPALREVSPRVVRIRPAAQTLDGATMTRQPVFLVISQVYVPDPTAVGQHLADAAAEMVRRGYRTIVYTARHGYEDSSIEYASREVKNGVEIRRLPFSSFGKGSVKIRLIAQIMFLLQAMIRGLFVPRLCGVLVSTSPPACGIGGAIISLVRRVPLKFWVMDLNPDQLVVMKVLGAKSWPVKLFEAFNLATLWKCSELVVLDRFMGERVQRKHDVAHKMHVMPPWPLDERVQDIAHVGNSFRERHVPEGKFVVMYSGNHSPANPLTTLLSATAELQDEERLHVLCIGGGGAKREVEAGIAAGVKNLASLPYQPVETLSQSLSAADLHVVSMGSDMVGICHPCKVYGAMAVSRPVLFFGPADCHIGELLAQHKFGWRVDHGDVAGAQRVLREVLAMPRLELQSIGRRGAAVLGQGYGKAVLLKRLCDVLQRGLPQVAVAAVPPAMIDTGDTRRAA